MAKPCRIVFFGTSDFAVPILDALRADGGFEFLEVVTQPDRPAGRKRALTAPPVKRAAETFGLKVWQPESIKGDDAAAHLSALGADAFVVVAYGKILPKRLLDIPALGGINVHGSLLPAYRGASPISAAIAAGERQTGVTVMKMDEKMDEGPMLATATVAIGEEDTTETLTPKLAAAAAALTPKTILAYADGSLAPMPQDHSKATYTTVLEREDGRIDWKKPAVEIERFVRAMRPWPEAFTSWKRKGAALKLIVRRAALLHPSTGCDAAGRVGTLCKLSDGSLGVNCGEGSIVLQEIQLEGKSAMDAKSFLNGYPDLVGATLE